MRASNVAHQPVLISTDRILINSDSLCKPCVISVPVYLEYPIFAEHGRLNEEERRVVEEIELYIDGSKKKQMVEWYLEYIETNIDRFLIQDSSFNFSVIPVMYLDTPPSSMPEIDRDLYIVRRFLDDLLIYRELVDPVRKVVQAAIDKMKRESEVVVWYCLCTMQGDGVTTAGSSGARIRHPSRLSRLREMIDDMVHLDMMEHYDNIFFMMDHSKQSADDPVVGVLGLIVNRLHRLENELKTIQNHWDPNKATNRIGRPYN
eukprot:gene7028-8170_t